MSQVHKIKLLRANLKRDLRAFSNMIPYVQVQMGEMSKKSMIDEKGGTKPCWNETLQFRTPLTTVKVSVYDSGSFTDSLVGSGTFNINKIPENQNQVTVDLMYDQNVVGKLYLKVPSKPIRLTYQETKSVFEASGANILNNSSNISNNSYKSQGFNPFQQLSKKISSVQQLPAPQAQQQQQQPPLFPQPSSNQPQQYTSIPQVYPQQQQPVYTQPVYAPVYYPQVNQNYNYNYSPQINRPYGINPTMQNRGTYIPPHQNNVIAGKMIMQNYSYATPIKISTKASKEGTIFGDSANSFSNFVNSIF